MENWGKNTDSSLPIVSEELTLYSMILVLLSETQLFIKGSLIIHYVHALVCLSLSLFWYYDILCYDIFRN